MQAKAIDLRKCSAVVKNRLGVCGIVVGMYKALLVLKLLLSLQELGSAPSAATVGRTEESRCRRWKVAHTGQLEIDFEIM